MCADVAEAPCGPGLGRIGAPGRLLLSPRFEPRAEPALDVIRAERLNLSQLTVENHLPRVADERVARVIVRQREYGPRFLNQLLQLFRLFQIERHRLVADDIESGG